MSATSPQIRMDDGLLDLVAIPDLDLSTLVSLAANLTSPGPADPRLEHWQVRRVTIDSDPVQPVLLDGEDLGDTPVTVEVVPRAMNILVPA